jgi:phenylpropionate dioxygenase-like ring-hydroxylating dioxygenase large terminal subunit
MAFTETQRQPHPTKSHTSVAHLVGAWYVVCESKQLRDKPLAVTLLDRPLVIFRDQNGNAGALLDRCAHRNVPLSLGAVKGNHLQCAYHGWEFDRSGTCQVVPGLIEKNQSHGRRVEAFAAREQDGFVWVYATPNAAPENEPFRFPLIGARNYTNLFQQVQAEASIHAVAENALDVPHTAYLHGGLFRSAKTARHEIEVVIRRWHDRVEAEYIGEPRPPGLAGKLLAPGGGTVIHFDRFILPSIVQVEYRLGEKSHICISSALTPVADFNTQLFTVISFRLPLPSWLIALLLRPIALRIFKQDADMLKRQTETIRHFNGEQYMSTEIDVLGPHIYRLLKQAERGEKAPVEEPFTRTIQMII